MQANSNVLCEPVKELAEALGVPVGQAVRLRKAVYGLVNAPRQWWNDVRPKMSKLGWVESSIEPCLWKLVDPHGQLVGLCVVHVDDFLIGLDEQSVYAKNKLQELRGLYQWGSWEDYQMCGVRLRQLYAGGQWGNVLLERYDYIRKILDIESS